MIHASVRNGPVQPGDVLVADMTDPNWEPVMKRAARDRHQPRRPHLPRGDHRARAGRAGGRRLRRRHRRAEGRRAGHGVVRRRRRRQDLRRPARNRSDAKCERGELPEIAGQDHDERRQSAAGVRLLAAAERRRRPGAARVHHQQQHRRAPEGDSRLSEHRCGPEEGRGIGGARSCVAARVLRRQAGRRHRHDRAPRSVRSR